MEYQAQGGLQEDSPAGAAVHFRHHYLSAQSVEDPCVHASTWPSLFLCAFFSSSSYAWFVFPLDSQNCTLAFRLINTNASNSHRAHESGSNSLYRGLFNHSFSALSSNSITLACQLRTFDRWMFPSFAILPWFVQSRESISVKFICICPIPHTEKECNTQVRRSASARVDTRSEYGRAAGQNGVTSSI